MAMTVLDPRAGWEETLEIRKEALQLRDYPAENVDPEGNERMENGILDWLKHFSECVG